MTLTTGRSALPQMLRVQLAGSAPNLTFVLRGHDMATTCRVGEPLFAATGMKTCFKNPMSSMLPVSALALSVNGEGAGWNPTFYGNMNSP